MYAKVTQKSKKQHNKYFKRICSIFSPQEGNFDIDAGDGGGVGGGVCVGGWGVHLGPKIPNNLKQSIQLYLSFIFSTGREL